MIYILDDNAFVTKVLQLALEHSGINPVRVATEWEQIANLVMRGTRRGDVMVCDVEMPRTSGLDVCRILRICNPQLPLVLFTSFPERVPAGLADAVVCKSDTALAVVEAIKEFC